jgi:RNA polymerase sigma-70 factor (ECF subfamily)
MPRWPPASPAASPARSTRSTAATRAASTGSRSCGPVRRPSPPTSPRTCSSHLLTRATDYDAARGPLAPWLLGIARNFVRRRTGTREVAEIDDADAAAPRDLVTPESALLARIELESLRRAIAALPPHYRDVLVLVELAERSYAEVAAICGLELNTVRSRLFRARALLARWLALDAETPGARSSAA